MRNHIKISLLSLLLFLMHGCSTTLSQEDWAKFCETSNWLSVGADDGNKGQSLDIVGTYEAQCGDNFTVTQAKEYQAGYLSGIVKFCSYENGYDTGYGEKPNPQTCPPEIANAFDLGFTRGKAQYRNDQQRIKSFARQKGSEEQKTPQSVVNTTASTGVLF